MKRVLSCRGRLGPRLDSTWLLCDHFGPMSAYIKVDQQRTTLVRDLHWSDTAPPSLIATAFSYRMIPWSSMKLKPIREMR